MLLVLFSRSQAAGNLDEAIHLYGNGKFKQAAILLQQLRNASPTEPDIRLWLGRSLLKSRQWDSAVREMEKAVQLQPSNARYHLWLGRACGARASHSVFFTALLWAHRVGKEFETAAILAPNDLDSRFDLLEFYVNAPGIVGGGKEKAEAEARTIANLDPRKGYTARATILEKNKNWDLARNELTQATIDYPRYANACTDLAEYLLGRRDFEGALLYAKKALALDSESKQAWLIAAAAATRLNTDLDQADKTLRALAADTLGENDPSFEEVYYWMGECYLARGDKAKARKAFESALDFNPDYAQAKNAIAESR